MEHVLGLWQKAAVFGALFFGGFALGGLALVVVCESWPRFSFALLTAFLGWCAVHWPLCMVGVEGTRTSEAEQGEAAAHLRARLALTTAR